MLRMAATVIAGEAEMQERALVYIVDDDAAVRHFLSFRLGMEGFDVRDFPDAQSFMQGYDARRPGCVVADLRMPRLSGLELLQWMGAQADAAPMIIMTGHGDLSATVAAFRGGAHDFLEKPFDEEYLIQRIRHALTQHETTRRKVRLRREAALKYRRLSRRERDVVSGLAAGRSNKEIAASLGLGLRTIESHRFQIMKKLDAASVCDVTRLMALIEE